MYIVSVHFQIKPDSLDAFLPLIYKQAENSLREEPDCLQFDVCRSTEDETHIYLYEKYTSRAAFEAHLNAPHYGPFNDAVTPMVADKQVSFFQIETS